MSSNFLDLLFNNKKYYSEPALYKDQISRYICSICYNIYIEPVTLDCVAGHTFCKECIFNSVKMSKKCPIDRHVIKSNYINNRDIFEINNLLLKCPNFNQNCNYTGLYKDMNNHLSFDCEYRNVQCIYCLEILKHNLLIDPEIKSEHELINCYTCNLNYYKCKPESHLHVECKYNCGQNIVTNKGLSNHYNICEAKPINCFLSGLGCEFIATKNSINKHEADMEVHRKLLIIANEKYSKYQKVYEQQEKLDTTRSFGYRRSGIIASQNSNSPLNASVVFETSANATAISSVTSAIPSNPIHRFSGGNINQNLSNPTDSTNFNNPRPAISSRISLSSIRSRIDSSASRVFLEDYIDEDALKNSESHYNALNSDPSDSQNANVSPEINALNDSGNFSNYNAVPIAIDPWTCEVCTYYNGSTRICEMCRGPNPILIPRTN